MTPLMPVSIGSKWAFLGADSIATASWSTLVNATNAASEFGASAIESFWSIDAMSSRVCVEEGVAIVLAELTELTELAELVERTELVEVELA